MIFQYEELLVSRLFDNNFKTETEILYDSFKLLCQIIESVKVKNNDFGLYSLVLLAAMNLKSFISAFDRVKKGYFGDSEAVFKRTVESLLAQAYFKDNLNDAERWCKNELALKNLNGNRKQLAQNLDKLNKDQHIFPTDAEDFFSEYIYEVGYSNSNFMAHLDFEAVHGELEDDNNDPKQFANNLILGPKYQEKTMKTILSRLIMFSSFQITLLKITFSSETDQYKIMFDRLNDYFKVKVVSS